jgi:diacylglycerol kinase family enzyme
MAGRGIPLAPLPAGTANNISRTLGLVGRPMEELVSGWPEARRMKLDVGLATGPWGERTFVEGFGAGLFASTVPLSKSDPALDKVDTPADKVKLALRRLKDRLERTPAVPLKAQLDGEDLSGEYVMFEALSIPYVGPNLYLAPDSKPGDGQFDLVMVTETERERLSHYLETWQEEKERLAVLPTRHGKHLRIEWNGFPVHIDDEFWPEKDGARPSGVQKIDLRIQEARIEFLVPEPIR